MKLIYSITLIAIVSFSVSAKNLQGLPEDSAGWTILEPSADSRIIYVSVEGSDSNDGLSELTPKRTIIAAIELLRDGFPDHLLLRRGDVFTENALYLVWTRSGRSALEPIVFSSYGTHPQRPIVKTGRGGAIVRTLGGGNPLSLDHLAIVGIHFFADQWDGMIGSNGFMPDGLSWIGAGKNLLIEDCKFERFSHGISIQTNKDDILNTTIRRNVIVDSFGAIDQNGNYSHSQGIIVGGVNRMLIEENVIDRSGWLKDAQGNYISSPPDVFKHNMYLASGKDIEVVRNISTRASSHGLQMREGGIIQNNLFARNPLAAFAAHGEGIHSQIRGNVVTAGVDIDDLKRGNGLDAVNTWQSTFDSNIITNTAVSHYYGNAFGIGGRDRGAYTTRARFTNNIVNNWKGSAFYVPGAEGDDYSSLGFSEVVVQNNRVRQTSGGYNIVYSLKDFAPSIFKFASNSYYSGNIPSQWFAVGRLEDKITLETWIAQSNDSDSVGGEPQFPDPNRTIETYAASIGLAPTFDAFINAARNQSKANWNPALTASAVNNYIRAGFGMAFDDIFYSTDAVSGNSSASVNAGSQGGCSLNGSANASSFAVILGAAILILLMGLRFTRRV